MADPTPLVTYIHSNTTYNTYHMEYRYVRHGHKYYRHIDIYVRAVVWWSLVLVYFGRNRSRTWHWQSWNGPHVVTYNNPTVT